MYVQLPWLGTPARHPPSLNTQANSPRGVGLVRPVMYDTTRIYSEVGLGLSR